jgi:glycerophosphoryl diester phosphodiesterase
MHSESDTPQNQAIHLIHHAAHGNHSEPAGSLAALAHCLAAGAAIIEIDILPLADGSFALLHERDLGAETCGAGDAVRATRDEIANLTYKSNGAITTEKIGFLEGAIALLQDHPQTQRLQLDLKPYLPLTGVVLKNFIELIEPVLKRVQVTTVADWVVRGLSQAIPELSLGFDPLLYLDLVEDDPRPESVPPFRIGAYGLLDDHPLAAYRWGAMSGYFAARAEGLWTQAQPAREWFIRAEVLEMAQKAGFDWIGFLHEHGCTVDAWTIDVTQPALLQTTQYLAEQGVDDLTTDTPERLAELLAVQAVY